MITATLLAVTLSITNACPRCKESPTTPISEASAIAAKRAGLPDETKWVIALINREHGYNITSKSRFDEHPRSKAYGLGQFKPKTWASVGITKTSCQVCQIEGIYRYCKHRKEYGSVHEAVKKWDSRGYWSKGRYRGGWY